MTDPTSTSRAAVGMGAIAAVSRAIGFVRVLVIAAVLGTTYLGNAFQSANSFSNVLFELLAAGALSAVLVPPFVELLEQGDDGDAEEVAGGVLGVALLVLGTVALVGVLAAPLLSRVLTVGVPEDIVTQQRDLVTFLLRFFIPQVVLYAAGAIATALLYAKRRFAVTAAAPIGNTVVMVLALILFRGVVGAEPSLDLSAGERWLLVLAGSGGVVAFVGTLLVALHLTGFRFRPRMPKGDERVRSVLAHSGWGVVLHTGAGLLLGGSLVAGSAVEGGVVAYQVAFVFFLAPYAILAQPIHTAILPELVTEAREPGLAEFRASLRWSLERMALFVLPVSAISAALALPAMRAVSFGEVGAGGTSLLAAALATMALGLYPYSAFLLLARAYYALGDSRTPGVVSLVSAVAGVAVMGVAAASSDGWARIALLGAGHSVAYGLGAAVLFVGLQRRAGGAIWPQGIVPMIAVVAAIGTATWLGGRAVFDDLTSRPAVLGGVAAAALLALGLTLGAFRALGLTGSLTRRGAPSPGSDALAEPPEVLA